MANVLNRFSLLFGRWLITALLMASIVITTRVYQGKGNFNAIHKQLFGVVIIVLQLLLGLNFVEAFKALANALKPKLTPWANKGEAEMIKQFDSLLTVLRLWQTATSTRLKALCFSWLSLNIVRLPDPPFANHTSLLPQHLRLSLTRSGSCSTGRANGGCSYELDLFCRRWP